MDIGIPLEISNTERRVALTPAGAHALSQAGHRVWVQGGAGSASHFSDKEYSAAGAGIVYDAEEVYGRAGLVLKVASPVPSEYEMLHEGQILVCFLHPVAAPPEGFRRLVERRVAAVAMEMIEDDLHSAPVLDAISEIAGPMSIHLAAHLLESEGGGRGILLGGASGIPAATVVILGAGMVGTTAARTALGNGASVIVLDRDVSRLRRIDNFFWHRATTMIADTRSIERAVQFADVLIGAVLIRGERAPHLVTESMVRSMKPGSVILDVSIDSGGCVETSRPTTLIQPTYIRHEVIHYAVPNMTAGVARTASCALSIACLPFALALADGGLEACVSNPALGRGLVTAAGRCLHPVIANQFDVPWADPATLLLEGRGERSHA
jgi:alanine dehydrogenase